ncbi:unnamed protein product [Closterium sp. NIES-65]|nr:unnamed protein product [Closterium sp. NIES-65]
MGTIVYRKMTLEEAKWKFPELRKVVRMGGECSPVEVPVTYGEVPGASDADVQERDEGAERATVDRPTPEEHALPCSAIEIIHSYRDTTLNSGLSSISLAIAAGYHCERDKAELPSDQVDDVADAVNKDAEEWSDDSDEWWLAGHYDGEEVEVWVAVPALTLCPSPSVPLPLLSSPSVNPLLSPPLCPSPSVTPPVSFPLCLSPFALPPMSLPPCPPPCTSPLCLSPSVLHPLPLELPLLSFPFFPPLCPSPSVPPPRSLPSVPPPLSLPLCPSPTIPPLSSLHFRPYPSFTPPLSLPLCPSHFVSRPLTSGGDAGGVRGGKEADQWGECAWCEGGKRRRTSGGNARGVRGGKEADKWGKMRVVCGGERRRTNGENASGVWGPSLTTGSGDLGRHGR